MRYLLDTHTAVWSAVATHRLPQSLVELILAEENDVYVSVVTLFEIAIKNAPGRRHQMPISVTDAARFFDEVPYATLNVEPSHAAALETLPIQHRDPFDRMLLAQAMATGMRLITRDRTLAEHSDVVLSF